MVYDLERIEWDAKCERSRLAYYRTVRIHRKGMEKRKSSACKEKRCLSPECYLIEELV